MVMLVFERLVLTGMYHLQVIVNERSVQTLALVNTGSLAYDYVWDVGSNQRIAVKPTSGTVGKGERVTLELAYHPHGPEKLRDYRVSCQVGNTGSCRPGHAGMLQRYNTHHIVTHVTG
jgi:hypothetical protein